MAGRVVGLSAGPNRSKKPYLLRFRSSKNFIVTVVFFMAFTDIFLYGLIVPVIPDALQKRAGIPSSEIQTWTTILLTVYGAALLVSSPIFGYIADKTSSRQLPLMVGLIILAGATAMLTAGTNIKLWVIGRALQGSSAAMVWTVGLAMLTDTVEENELGKYLGVVSLAMTAGTLLGPLLGGVVYDHGGYYAVFGLAFGAIALDILLRIIMIEKKKAKQFEVEDEDDYTNRPLLAGQSGPYGAASSSTGDAERTQTDDATFTKSANTHGLPPVIWLLKSVRLLVALWAGMVFAMMITGFDAVVPIFVSETFGWSSTGSGLIFLALFIPSLTGPFIGMLTDKYGPRWLMSGGLLFALPFYILLRLVDHKSLGQEVLLCALLGFIGITITMVSAPAFTEIIHIVHAKEAENPGVFGPGGASAQAYGLFNLAFAAGTILGPMYAGFIKHRFGWGNMGLAIGVLAAVSSIPVALMTGGWVGNRHNNNH